MNPTNETNDFELELSYEDLSEIDNLEQIFSDDDLEKEIKQILSKSLKIDGTEVLVSVKHGIVTLSGFVHSHFDRDYAISISRVFNGVSQVESALMIRSPDDIEIK